MHHRKPGEKSLVLRELRVKLVTDHGSRSCDLSHARALLEPASPLNSFERLQRLQDELSVGRISGAILRIINNNVA